MKKSFKNLYMFFIYAFLYAPLILAMILSFNKGPHLAQWYGFSLTWYKKLLANNSLISSTMNSLLLSSVSATLTTILGLIIGIALYRYKFVGKKIISMGLYILILSPEIILGISFVVFFILVGIPLGFTTLLLSHITFCVPFVAVTILARLHDFDRNIIEAAQDLGATEPDIIRHIICPISLPAILTGWLMSFTLSLDDVIISFFVNGPSFEILPIKIYSMVRSGVKPEINALCTIMFLLTFIIILICHLFFKGEKK